MIGVELWIMYMVLLILGNKMKKIGNFAFARCSSLKTIYIPFGIQYIGMDAFANCSCSLESVTVDVNNKVYCAINNCLIETAAKENGIPFEEIGLR